MGPILLNSPRAGAEADQWRTTTSAHLGRRARHYRLAAAVADCPQDVVMFCDLAMMFDQLAHEFRRFENQRLRAFRNQTTNHRGAGLRSIWLARLGVGLNSMWIVGLPDR